MKTTVFLIVLASFSFMLIISCDDGINNPHLITNNALCYKKVENSNWEILTNNLSGNNPINISNSLENDEYPEWSPNGKYILYKHSTPKGGPVANVYNLEKNATTSVTSDSGEVGIDGPKWLPNGKIFAQYRTRYDDPYTVYTMNPDGSGKNKVRTLDFGTHTYFYQDSYTFLSVIGSKVYKTNIDNSYDEFILDLQPGNDQFLTIRDFNPIEEKLLINTNTVQGVRSAIVEYNVKTKQMELIISAEKGFSLVLQRYSKDYSKIAFIEINTSTYKEEFLSIFENSEKKRLLKLIDDEWFDYNPMKFSYDGNYIAFSKNTDLEGDWVSWRSDLYVVDITTEKLYFIDEGQCASWNSKY